MVALASFISSIADPAKGSALDFGIQLYTKHTHNS
jgi:hypothetical protein